MTTELPHLDESSRLRMIDVGSKVPVRRTATATATVNMEATTLERVQHGGVEKGDVTSIATVAAVMAAKRTPDLIPGCHPLAVSSVDVNFEFGEALTVEATVSGVDRTGFEMEALTAATIAALTVFDMVKGIDPTVEITDVRVLNKTGGKGSIPALDGVKAAVITVSDTRASGKNIDESGPAATAWLERAGATVAGVTVVPDEHELIADAIRSAAKDADLVITTGGTGPAPRDVTPEATRSVLDREIPGIGEAIRSASLRKTRHAMLSRGIAGNVGRALVINVPGSVAAVGESLDAVASILLHAITLTRGQDVTH